MASTIRIKRSLVSGNPNTLAAGELAYSALPDNGSNGGDRLYIGMGTETLGNAANHVVIGGKFFTDQLDHTKGVLTADSAIVVDANSKIDNLKVDNLDFNGNTISSTDTNGNIILDPAGSGYVEILGTNALVIPVGNTAQRAPSMDGAIRLNSESGQFEGYSAGSWASLGGVRSVDGQTFITAELTPGASDDTLRFYTDGVLNMFLDTTSLDVSANVITTFNNDTESTDSTTGAVVISGGVGIAKDVYIGGDLTVTGAQTIAGDFGINGGDLYSTATTFNLLNRDSSSSTTEDGPETVNAFLGATAINVGASNSLTTINGQLGVSDTLTVTNSTTLLGDVVIGQSGTPVAVTVHGTSVDITGTEDSTIGVSGTSGTAVTQVIQAVNSVGDANLDINVDTAFTLDAESISIDATDSSNISMVANSSATKTLLIDAQNVGAGDAVLQLGTQDTDVTNIDALTEINLTSVDVNISSTGFNVDAQTVDITTTGSGNSITATTLGVTVNADTILLQGTEGVGDATEVTVVGRVDIDNVRIDGNTISTTDGSNTLYLDPAPTNDNGGTVVIKGDLQVDGTTTTINSTEVTIDDPIFTLGGDTAPTMDDNLDRGIQFRWHNGTSAKEGFFGWSDLDGEFQFIADATNTSSVFTPAVSGVYGNAKFGKLTLTDDTESTTTSTGALTVAGGVGISGQLNVAGGTNKFTATTVSTSTTTGAVVVAGGMGVDGTIYLGTDLIGAGDTISNISGFNIDGGTY